MDHFSDFTYVHLMTTLDAEHTVEAKRAFERIAASHGVVVKHYHSDNGLFDTKLFKESIQNSHQTLSFCGPYAHHQNGKAENRIKDITTHARTALLHAAHRWPKAVNAHLWPAALKHYTNSRNSLPSQFLAGKKVGKKKEPDQMIGSPISRFCGTEVEPNLDHFHPFGCPVYVLSSSLQSQKSHNKWTDRSRVGIFLCHSPNHATSVPLVLNTQTGNVAPQFHCIYDDEFATCKRDANFVSQWQHKAKFPGSPMRSTVERMDQLPTIPTELINFNQPSNMTMTNDGPPTSRLTEPAETSTTLPDTENIELPPINDLVENIVPSIQGDDSTPVAPDRALEDATIEAMPQRTTRSGRVVKPRQIFTLLTLF